MIVAPCGMTAIIPSEKIEIVVDGAFAEPQLNHPEGICADPKGYLWCGGERGEVYRIDPERHTFELVASTEGFLLGLNFGPDGGLYLCDNKKKCIYRYNPESGELNWLTGGSANRAMRIPNYPLYDQSRDVLYVSDSYGYKQPGPGIWRINPQTGHTELWCSDNSFNFANGLALSLDGNTLYVAESWGRCVSRVEIDGNWRAGKREVWVSLPEDIPDGLVMDTNGDLYITSYEPSRIYRINTLQENAELELVVWDKGAHELCHPTNAVLLNGAMYVSNLGRWHVSKVDLKAIRG